MFSLSVCASDLNSLIAAVKASRTSDTAKSHAIFAVKSAVEKGFDLNQIFQESRGGITWQMTLCHVAAADGHNDVVSYLVCRGADPTINAIPDKVGICHHCPLGFMPGLPLKLREDNDSIPRDIMQDTECAVRMCGGMEEFDATGRIKQLEEGAEQNRAS